jgi:hypothetical protein
MKMKTHWAQGYSAHNFNMAYGEKIGTRQGGDICNSIPANVSQAREEIKCETFE